MSEFRDMRPCPHCFGKVDGLDPERSPPNIHWFWGRCPDCGRQALSTGEKFLTIIAIIVILIVISLFARYILWLEAPSGPWGKLAEKLPDVIC